ncbi:MAG: hypothetical protein ACRC6N_11295 [Plesiomonas sp.]|uniref:hypothetical protein n=1 Tax=Plesiomonas sp. TaxID=2486279 RepID=UPI003F368971
MSHLKISTNEYAVKIAVAAMHRAKAIPVWDSVPYELHVELDAIFNALSALSSPTQINEPKS